MKDLPKRGQPTKTTPGAHQQLIQEVPEEHTALLASPPQLS